MANLELKIPPLLLVIVFALIMWLISICTQNIHISDLIRYVIFLLFVLIGVFFILAGVISFKRSRTTVNPTLPHTASSLVSSGIYKVTRNPMYVGFLMFLMGWGLFLSNIFSTATIVIFVLYMNQFQIKPEERALVSIFGEEYLRYQRKVRRWF